MGGWHSAHLGTRAEELPLRSDRLDLPSDSVLRAPEGTYTVSQLGGEIQQLLRAAWSSVWVVGEVSRHRSSAAGHHYFDLVEKGDADRIVGTLSAVIWRGEWRRLGAVLERAGERLDDGLAVRCRVGLDFYPPGGRLQAQVREIDPSAMCCGAAGVYALLRPETSDELDFVGPFVATGGGVHRHGHEELARDR